MPTTTYSDVAPIAAHIYIYIFISLYPSSSLNTDLRKTVTNLLYSRVSWERETKDLAMTKLGEQRLEPRLSGFRI